MSRALADGGGAVMTAATLIRRLVMRKRCDHRQPHIGGMTGFTQVSGERMSRRLKGARAHPIVTAGTGAGLPRYRRMIKGHAQPGGGVMAGITLGGGGNMSGTFASGDITVMASVAWRRGLAVVDR